MKQILIDLDERCFRELERVAPSKKRQRAEFVRLAIRRALDLALDRETEAAYAACPMTDEVTPEDGAGWDPENELAKPASPRKPARRRSRPRAPGR